MLVKRGENNIKSSSAENIVFKVWSGFNGQISVNFSHVFFSLYRKQVTTQYWHHLVSDLINDGRGNKEQRSLFELLYRFNEK